MTLNFDFKDQTVVVTGGTRGLGRSIAHSFAQAGARVAITGRSANAAEEARSLGSGVTGYTCDVADPIAYERFIERVLLDLGSVDVLVNNAGISPWYTKSENVLMSEWNSIIAVNLTGAFIGCQLFGRLMLSRGSGSIINVSSIAARSGLPRGAAYCAAKGGLEALTRSLAVDWAAGGVRVNNVAPGYFATDLTSGLRDNQGLSQIVKSRTPMKRFGEPYEIVGACLFLASKDAAYITGQTLMVDGGWGAS